MSKTSQSGYRQSQGQTAAKRTALINFRNCSFSNCCATIVSPTTPTPALISTLQLRHSYAGLISSEPSRVVTHLTKASALHFSRPHHLRVSVGCVLQSRSKSKGREKIHQIQVRASPAHKYLSEQHPGSHQHTGCFN